MLLLMLLATTCTNTRRLTLRTAELQPKITGFLIFHLLRVQYSVLRLPSFPSLHPMAPQGLHGLAHLSPLVPILMPAIAATNLLGYISRYYPRLFSRSAASVLSFRLC